MPPVNISSCYFGLFAQGTRSRPPYSPPSPPATHLNCHQDHKRPICCRCSWAARQWLKFCWLASWTESCRQRWDYRHWWFCRSCPRWDCGCPEGRGLRSLRPCDFRSAFWYSMWRCPRGRWMHNRGRCPKQGISCRGWPLWPICRCWPCGPAKRRSACLLIASICRFDRPCCRSPTSFDRSK